MVLLNVVLTTYNRPIFLKEALEAILCQTFKDFRLYILDNGSDNDTQKILSSINDPRVKIIRNEINSLEFVNEAFKLINSKYLILTHDDDIMELNFLKEQISLLEKDEKINLIASRISLIDENSKILRKIRPRLFFTKTWNKGEFLNSYLFRGNIIPCPTIIFRSDFVKQNQLKYNWTVGPATDFHLLLKANSYEGKIVLNKKPLYRYRIHKNQASELNRIYLEFKAKKEVLKLLKTIKMGRFINAYVSASNGQILNILVESILNNKITLNEFKKYFKELAEKHDFKVNIYTIYWGFIGLFRGIKNKFF